MGCRVNGVCRLGVILYIRPIQAAGTTGAALINHSGSASRGAQIATEVQPRVQRSLAGRRREPAMLPRRDDRAIRRHVAEERRSFCRVERLCALLQKPVCALQELGRTR